MAISTQSVVPSRNQLIVSALCKRLNLESKNFQGDILQKDIKSLCASILTTLESNGEVMKWIEFAENFSVDSEACLKALNELNGCLASKSVLVGEGLTPSEADIIVFLALYSYVKGLSDSDREELPHLMRWMDYIQWSSVPDGGVPSEILLLIELTSSLIFEVVKVADIIPFNKEDFGKTFEQILIEKDTFEPPASKNVEKVETDSNAKKAVQDKKDANSVEKGSSSNKNANAIKGDGQVVIEKKKLPEKVADEKDKDISVSLLKIQVGLIRKAWKHPSADSLLVEEIDTGDAKLRQVVSGLAKYCSPDELTNRRVVLITNVKPGKLRDIMSEGLVLCASSEDHSVVEPLIAPEGAKVGECISFSGHEGKPEDVLNPKKKQLEKITPHLFTDDKGVATFKGIPFMTSAGPCTSSIPKASIK
ncbi:LOW QUALITY PROTEIN: methionine--tRNA ligase, cytoplasmic [Camellia sinensis]|uniref:LOW QUALITY PROTEIN: methionine--tRNA ligase, cytoplasmic n=1 Tax=Camellia sinensis TaxID=4442 RepID=UPI001035B708|nr:LOW QUALITY PROTEIN: methionine--tRNA ligase, cytoplasmic [Camellia sinensis]